MSRELIFSQCKSRGLLGSQLNICCRTAFALGLSSVGQSCLPPLGWHESDQALCLQSMPPAEDMVASLVGDEPEHNNSARGLEVPGPSVQVWPGSCRHVPCSALLVSDPVEGACSCSDAMSSLCRACGWLRPYFACAGAEAGRLRTWQLSCQRSAGPCAWLGPSPASCCGRGVCPISSH